MLRRFGASVAVLALLYGLFAAPYTHAHHAIDSVSDEHHPHGQSLVHTHATPHGHHDNDKFSPEASATHDGDEQIWSVDSFLFQQPTLTHPPTPALLVFAEPPIVLISVWLGADRPQPKAHGPPLAWSSALRAPPVLLPTFA
jgi:hypothetical protein